ncbi:hypothetical protein [Sphingobacterium endophyticum]|uniref:hypothetical protein n=1 Tax=Sphingobacterium endophyticum TaxID=2546448 RepID=UPI0012E2C7F2|nr:hypothetical protein [Sphingobacterium endophyticum]
MKKLVFICIIILMSMSSFAQTGVDTIHYRKVYYFGGTGLSFPLGKTKDALTTKPFTGSMGLDISLKNPKYYLQPTLYMMSFGYNQLEEDTEYNRILKNARSTMYILSLAGGIRKQLQRLNTYAYIGPAGALNVEPRAQDDAANSTVNLSYEYSISPAFKFGIGSDYKFKGFFLGMEAGYMHNFRKIQGNPVHVLSIMVGLKSDITKLSDKVVEVISK